MADDGVRSTYAARDAARPFTDWRGSVYHPRHPMGRLYVAHNRETLVDMVNTLDLDLTGLRVLDVGCGGGFWLRNLVELGAQPANLTGIDISAERLAFARNANPAITWVEGGDDGLPFADNEFDLLLQVLVFSSIPEETARGRLAAEMVRVARPGGRILWLDLLPSESHLATFSREHVQAFFPEARLVYERPVQPRYFRHHHKHPWLCNTVYRFTRANCESSLLVFEKC